MSHRYPSHPKNCPCSGCYHCNIKQLSRNEALDEALCACEAYPNWTTKDLAVYLRSLKWDFEKNA